MNFKGREVNLIDDHHSPGHLFIYEPKDGDLAVL